MSKRLAQIESLNNVFVIIALFPILAHKHTIEDEKDSINFVHICSAPANAWCSKIADHTKLVHLQNGVNYQKI